MARKPNPISQRYELRAPPEEKELWQQAAALEGVDLATFARQQLTRGARKVLAKAEASGASKKVRI